MALERLQKVLASAGLASRRACEEMILDRRVAVNGKQVSTLPALVDPESDRITVDGQLLRAPRKVYFMLHKPKGVHCTNDDPQSRTRAIDLLPRIRERVFPVGRLDADSTGLLLLTNDGELAQRLTHPRFGVPKTYRVHLPGLVGNNEIARLLKGVWLHEGKAHVSEASVVHAGRDGSMIEVTLREGRNREIRRVMAKLGFEVRKLVRIRMGPLSLSGLPIGASRPLSPDEVKSLRQYRAPAPRKKPAAELKSLNATKSGKKIRGRKTAPAAQPDKDTRRIATAPDGTTILRRR
ncbi:MAG TPA: pseudouridine synthase [Phycisphaerae bacterium]|nr:pseudouridine synthase [Phycisphaerae bacterium]HRY66868.1 pseudouridine synthase [Phycisphaerae bacterium]HSA26926.1 pseudouridine synthase [Phycisphaerae bacterium]